MVPISIVVAYVADKIVGKFISESGFSLWKKWAFPKKKYKQRLVVLINQTIDYIKLKYNVPTSDDKYRFYDSQIIFSELSKHILFKTTYDSVKIIDELKNHPRIIPPTREELEEFFNYFITSVNSDEKLEYLHIEENFKQEIFDISAQFEHLFEILNDIKNVLKPGADQVENLLASDSPLYIMTNKTTPLDLEILSAIRRTEADPEQLERHFQIYQKGLDAENLSYIKSCLKVINSNIIPVHTDQADITVKITPDKSSIFSFENNVISVDTPKLLWDCNCRIKCPDGYVKKPCPIHKDIKEQSIKTKLTNLFAKGIVKICVSDLEIFWNDRENLWPPSMDSIYLIEDLKANGYDKKFLNRIIDIGCGTGYLGIWIAKNNRFVKEAVFTDWMLLPLIFAYINNISNNLTSTYCKYSLGINTNWIFDELNKFDLAVCNPPYLPLLTGKENFRYETTVAGTELLENYIENWSKFSSEALISFSDIALPEAETACRKSNSKLVPIGLKRKVPFRVTAAFDEKEYIKKLLEQNRIEFEENSTFPYWHYIQSYKLTRL